MAIDRGRLVEQLLAIGESQSRGLVEALATTDPDAIAEAIAASTDSEIRQQLCTAAQHAGRMARRLAGLAGAYSSKRVKGG